MDNIMPYSTWRSDVWSLGIILINILTGRNPWQLANISRDEGYAQYVRGRGFFLSCILAISRDAAELLSHILDPNPRTRITLAKLRRAVLEIRTFFPPQDDDVPGYIRAADESFRASLEHTVIVEEEDDGELIIDVPFDMGDPIPSSADLVSIPLGSPQSHEHISMFVNEGPSPYSSTGTDETLPPATPVSAATNIPAVVPAFALVAESGYEDAKDGHGEHHSKLPRNVRRLIGMVRRVALRA
jgi:serine/threonine protein kinase